MSTFERPLLFLLRHTPYVLFVGVFVAFGLLSPRLLEVESLLTIVKQASYIGIVAVGMTFVLLTAGIDLSVGATMFISAAVGGMVMQSYGVALGAAAGLGSGLLFGMVNALAVTRLGIKSFIVTLATLVAGRGLGLYLTQSRAVPYPEGIVQAGSAQLFGVLPLPVAIFAAVVLAAHIVLTRTPFGRRVYAVGGSEDGARKAGINVRRVVLSVFVLCGFLSALGGLVSVMQMGIVNPGFGEGREFDAIAAAVLGGTSLFGGRGSVFPGTVIGALLIQMVNTGLVFLQVDLYVQPLVIAAVILLAVFIDSLRTTRLERMQRRRIRTME